LNYPIFQSTRDARGAEVQISNTAGLDEPESFLLHRCSVNGSSGQLSLIDLPTVGATLTRLALIPCPTLPGQPIPWPHGSVKADVGLDALEPAIDLALDLFDPR
jgi:hypothetical protein